MCGAKGERGHEFVEQKAIVNMSVWSESRASTGVRGAKRERGHECVEQKANVYMCVWLIIRGFGPK